MKKINRPVMVLLLSLILSAPIYAGDILMGITTDPPAPSQQASTGQTTRGTDGAEAAPAQKSASEFVVQLVTSILSIF